MASVKYVVHVEDCMGLDDRFVESQATISVASGSGHQRYQCSWCGAETPWRELGAPKERVLLKDRIKMDEIRSF